MSYNVTQLSVKRPEEFLQRFNLVFSELKVRWIGQIPKQMIYKSLKNLRLFTLSVLLTSVGKKFFSYFQGVLRSSSLFPR